MSMLSTGSPRTDRRPSRTEALSGNQIVEAQFIQFGCETSVNRRTSSFEKLYFP
jgi:hypothetical protein